MSEVSAGLLRAVAEAADGFRTGEKVWISASEAELDELRVFHSEADARADANTRSGRGWDVFGPYVTREPEEMAESVVTIEEVTIRYSNGETETRTPRDTEAVFLSFAALDRFLFPYYARVRGVDFAARLREAMLAGRQPLCCKTPWSLFFKGKERESDPRPQREKGAG